MTEQIPIGRTLKIRGCGFDEYWLQDEIYRNPRGLGLGDLESLSKEKPQAGGGRLDLLLKDPDDDSMFEVEVMLGETDESHIIRTIEYWDRVKRQWPQRQHYAVLVAESITRRFFNVIQLLSQNVPLIAIQANIVEVNGNKALTFTKVLDVYEEPGEPGTEIDEITTEEDWRKKAPWTLETATALLEIVKPVWGEVSLGFTKSSITLRVNQNNYFWFHKRSSNKSRLNFRIDRENLDNASSILDEAGVSFPAVKVNIIRVIVDKKMIQSNAERLRNIANLVRQYWEG